jgi:hypothetical protein
MFLSQNPGPKHYLVQHAGACTGGEEDSINGIYIEGGRDIEMYRKYYSCS